MFRCLNVWPPVSEGGECLRVRVFQCLSVRVSDLGGFRCLEEESV